MQLKVDTPDLRSAVIFDHVEDASLNGVSVKGNTQTESALRFIDSFGGRVQERRRRKKH